MKPPDLKFHFKLLHLFYFIFFADGIDEKVQNGKDLFKHLIQVGTLGSNNLNHLADMLQEIHRRDLAEKVRKFQAVGKLLILLKVHE